jgi:nitrous oxide reductase accessory protein NosL
MIKSIMVLTLLLLSTGLLSTGCEERSKTDVAKVHWDRDMCARCVMVVSDRQNTTQVRNPKTGKKYMFDDIGCAILWFKDENITWRDQATIWITDVNTSKWIDARKAFYDTENITPMAYGFSAHASKKTIKEGQEIVDFEELSRRVLVVGK